MSSTCLFLVLIIRKVKFLCIIYICIITNYNCFSFWFQGWLVLSRSSIFCVKTRVQITNKKRFRYNIIICCRLQWIVLDSFVSFHEYMYIKSCILSKNNDLASSFHFLLSLICTLSNKLLSAILGSNNNTTTFRVFLVILAWFSL